ncbi:hypothetical protein BC828DRAFT_408196, partial [Blastocladiella britannica]
MLVDCALSELLGLAVTLEYSNKVTGTVPVSFPDDDDEPAPTAQAGITFKTDTHLGTAAILSIRHGQTIAALDKLANADPNGRMYGHDVLFFLPGEFLVSLPDHTWTLSDLAYDHSGGYKGTATITAAMTKAGARAWFLRRIKGNMTLTVIGKDRHAVMPKFRDLTGLTTNSKVWKHHGTA